MAKDIKFSDGLLIEELEIVRIKKRGAEFKSRLESGSNLWEDQQDGFITTPARAVKIGEYIYNEDGTFLAYRVS